MSSGIVQKKHDLKHELSAEKLVFDTGICVIDISLTMVTVSPCSYMSARRTLRTESSTGYDLN